jgi:hypothetical protein
MNAMIERVIGTAALLGLVVFIAAIIGGAFH